MKLQSAMRPPLSALALAALLCAAGPVWAQGSAAATQVPESVKRLATTDAREQRARWGDLAAAVGKYWLSAAPGEAAKVANVWRTAHWIVPGAAMRYQRGFCVATRCSATDYVVHYNPEAKQLDFFDKDEKIYTSRIGEDGSVRLVGTGLVGVLTTETLKFDAATGTLHSEKHELRAVTAAQFAEATGGFTGPSGQPAAASSSPSSSEEQMRAEMAAMKAQIEALQKQVQATGPAPAASRDTPAAPTPGSAAPAQALSPAEQKAAQQREALEARLRDAQQRKAQAEERKLTADQRAQEEAQARIDAARKGKEAAEARVVAAQQALDAEAAKPRQPATRP
jgi:hypothetical protein